MEGSETGSREGSDVACTEGICNHDEHGMLGLNFLISIYNMADITP
jgi:hypothetical protein